MILGLIAYFVTFYLMMKLKTKYKLKRKSFPYLKMNKTGITFFSHSEHKIKIQNMKIMQVENNVYLKQGNNLIIITNVSEVKGYEDYLLFTSNGETRILFDCNDYFRYFAINIKSEQFSLDEIKQSAILDLMNNNFDINLSVLAKRYINILKNTLNINFDNKKLIIKPNRFKFSFTVIYKVNNKIKHVNIRQRI